MTPVTVELVHETCWCGMPFMLPSALQYQARNRGHTIYCPLGHTIVWKETEADKLRRERDNLKQQIARVEDEKQREVSLANDRATRAERETKRIKKRAAAGTCPCCQRTFSNMATHMKRQHPDYVKETGANVVPIKQGAA